MEWTDRRADEAVLWRTRRQRLRLECRECEVICERVISPWRCLKSGCDAVYAYEDGETTYFGCLHKVFSPELDLAAFSPSEQGAARGRSDPYGAIRISRSPRPHCRVTIEQAYEVGSTGGMCCNPTFFHHPAGDGENEMRLTAKSIDGDPGVPG
jgi:hypothetical protein